MTARRRRFPTLAGARALAGARVLVLAALGAVAACESTDAATGPEPRRVRAAYIAVVSGRDQQGTVGTALPRPLVVEVRDLNGGLVTGELVTFQVLSGGGSLSKTGALTDAAGLARTTWTLGPQAGLQRVEAAIGASSTNGSVPWVDFDVVSRPDVPAAIQKVAGDAQVGVAGGWTPVPPRIRVVDRFGNAVPGATVQAQASGGGEARPEVETDSTGEARSYWRLGTTGADTLQLTVAGAIVTRFVATSAPGLRYQLTFTGTRRGSALAGSTIVPPFVLVTELNAPDPHPQGIALVFAVTGGGTLAASAASTDTGGVAPAPAWTLAGATGANTLTATAPDGASVSIVVQGVLPFTARQVSAGAGHSCAIDLGGATWCWGLAASGQLGLGTFDTTRTLPVQLPSGTFASLTVGSAYSCALTASGAAWCWGSNNAGQLGDGTLASRASPVAVSGGLAFAQLSASANANTCGVTTDGRAYCWGDGVYGQLGVGDTTRRTVPTAVASTLAFREIAVGGPTTCALTTDGAAWCWGYNFNGSVGAATTETCATGVACARTPVAVSGGLHFDHVAVASATSCGLSAGDVWCWGGIPGSATSSFTPVRLTTNAGVVSFAVGGGFACTIDGAGTLRCWGQNSFGQLGIGTNETEVATPRVVGGSLKWKSVSVFGARACAIDTSDVTWCWGNPVIGDASLLPSLVPVMVGRR